MHTPTPVSSAPVNPDLANHPRRLIAISEVAQLVGRQKTSIYAELADPKSTFPKPVKLGRSTRFVLGEVLEFVEGQIAARDAAPAGAQ